MYYNIKYLVSSAAATAASFGLTRTDRLVIIIIICIVVMKTKKNYCKGTNGAVTRVTYVGWGE